MTKIKNYLALIRVHQWFKNILILLPVITTQKNIGSETYINLIIIFISFSLASSLVYVFNDFFDKNEDIKHPLKKTKPIANKSINLNEVIIIFIIIFLLFLFIITKFGMKSENTYLIFGYLFLSFIYTVLVKKIIFFDVLLVASFYVFRIKCGVNEIDEDINNLIYLQIYTAAIFILLCKRFSDLNFSNNIYKKYFNILKFSIDFILLGNIIIYFLIINSEYLYEKYGGKPYYFTVLFVIISFLRYRHYTLKNKNTLDPVKILFKSKVLILSNFLWIVSIFLLNNML